MRAAKRHWPPYWPPYWAWAALLSRRGAPAQPARFTVARFASGRRFPPRRPRLRGTQLRRSTPSRLKVPPWQRNCSPPWPPGAGSPGSWLRHALGTSRAHRSGPMVGCSVALRPRRGRRFRGVQPPGPTLAAAPSLDAAAACHVGERQRQPEAGPRAGRRCGRHGWRRACECGAAQSARVRWRAAVGDNAPVARGRAVQPGELRTGQQLALSP